MMIGHPVITDVVTRGDPDHESSVVKVLTGAGRAAPPGRSIKRMLQLRYTAHLIRIGGTSGCRAGTNAAKTALALKASSKANAGTTGVRATAWRGRIGRVNWGPSEAGAWAQGWVGINHKPPGGNQRRGYGHSKRRAGRTIQPAGEPRAIGPRSWSEVLGAAWTRVLLRNKRRERRYGQ